MADIVKRCSVEHHKVLVRATASHIDSGKAFHAALHAGHQLNSFDDIWFAQYHRHVFNHLLRNFQCAHISGLYAGVLSADNRGCFQCHRLFQCDIHNSITLKVNVLFQIRAPYVRVSQFNVSARDGNRIVSKFVSDGTYDSRVRTRCLVICLHN